MSVCEQGEWLVVLDSTVDSRDVGMGEAMSKKSVLNNPYCLYGWKSPKPCNYSGGCGCWKDFKHEGWCRCETCGSRKRRPAQWDDEGRAEANK